MPRDFSFVGDIAICVFCFIVIAVAVIVVGGFWLLMLAFAGMCYLLGWVLEVLDRLIKIIRG